MKVMKELRQRQIREIVGSRPIRTQQELATALRERGLRATQATISRDVAELGLVKVGRLGAVAYALPSSSSGQAELESTSEERLARLLRDVPLQLREAGLLLVIKTIPGSAHAIAAALDRSGWPELVGSIAGDDTVFVALRDRASVQRVRQRMQRLAGG